MVRWALMQKSVSLMDLIGKRIQVIGSTQNGPEYLYEALDFVAKGKVKVIAETYKLDEAPKAYQRVVEGKARFRASSPCKSRVRAKRRSCMKAIRVKEFGGPEKLQLEDVPNPKPGPGQVVVKIEAAGVNPVDVYMRAGTYPRKPPLPYTPGTDGAGTILSVGEGVDSVAPGARVYTAGSLSGTYAEQALCEAWAVFPLPANAWFSQGASMHVPYGTAYRALFQKAKALPAETVLIQGASGGVGIAAVQLARAAGLHVVGTASSERGRKLVADEGATSSARPQRAGPFRKGARADKRTRL